MSNICKQFSEVIPKKVALFGDSIQRFDVPTHKESTCSIRDREFLLGRYCASKALELMGRDKGVVGQNHDGSPIWPNGTIGSITHSKGFAVAVAALSKDYQSLGIDLEQMNRLKPTSIARIVHESEQNSIKDDVRRGTVLFALKESFYKAQFPIYKKKLNFKDVAFSIDFNRCEAQVQWTSSKLNVPKSVYNDWKVTFKLVENYVFVFCLFENA